MTSLTPFNSIVRRRVVASLTALTLSLGALTGCSAVSSALQAETSASATVTAVDGIWDPDSVHEVALTIDEDEFAAMVETYQESGEKEWLSADVTIDGQTFRDVGVRLKGNSSLRGVDPDADPATLPWLVDLDKLVDGQSLDGWERFVVRSNNTETSLNEAVALDLLEEAGLASQSAVASRFSVNGSDATLRLLVQDLDDRWDAATFGTDGTLYKAEAGGDWSFRGDDADSYTDVFDVEAGTEDFEPLTDFLQWLEESSDDEFADGLADRLDVDAFATYLAFEDLVGNFDDIDGPGNNAYLRWDAEAGQMTVVAWDHNLSFGVTNGMGGPAGGDGSGPPERGERPEGVEPPEGGAPEGFEPPGGGPGGERPDGAGPAGAGPDGATPGGPGGSNVLAERFRDTPAFAALYDDALERLQSELMDDGTAQAVLDAWTALLSEQAADLVGESALEEDAQQVASYFDGHGVEDPADGVGVVDPS